MSSDAQAIKPIVVLDSNVIISGLVFDQGNPAEILDFLWEGNIQAHVSPFIFEEVRRALSGNKFRWHQSQIDEIIAFLELHCTVVNPLQTVSLDELSSEDNRVLDCAVEGQVQYVVTGDRGFRRIGEYQGILIVSPLDFMTILRTET